MARKRWSRSAVGLAILGAWCLIAALFVGMPDAIDGIVFGAVLFLAAFAIQRREDSGRADRPD